MEALIPIVYRGTRILRPIEFELLVNKGLKKEYHQQHFKALLFTGMRYVEYQRFMENPQWLDQNGFIHLPSEATKTGRIDETRKKKGMRSFRTIKERWIRLNKIGVEVVKSAFKFKNKLPTLQAWKQLLARAAPRAAIPPDGLTIKTTRKTWESWLVFAYPEKRELILQSQGHTDYIALTHYLSMPFTDEDKRKILEYVAGWG